MKGWTRGLLGAVLLATAALPARAIEGGAMAGGRDALTRATVAVGTLGRSDEDDDKVNLTRCSGVLIAPSLVLTAAHCVGDNPLGAAVMFYRGSRPVRPAYRAAAVARYVVERDDDIGVNLSNLALDIAVVRLAAPVRDRAPVPLARASGLPGPLRIAGVGLSGGEPGTLKTARLVPLAVTGSGLTLARAVGARVCIGDSGGPVVTGGGRLWGVASAVITRSPPCGDLVVIAPAGQRLTGAARRGATAVAARDRRGGPVAPRARLRTRPA